MTSEMQIIRVRGGNRHPLSSRQFVLDHLGLIGEDYGASMHRAYKNALDRVAITRGRRFAYHYPNYHSFQGVVNGLAREGEIEFSGREEESDNPMFANMEWKPVRRYYRLATGRPAAGGRQDGHRVASETRKNTDGTRRGGGSMSRNGNSRGG